jgi:hypothetical protein
VIFVNTDAADQIKISVQFVIAILVILVKCGNPTSIPTSILVKTSRNFVLERPKRPDIYKETVLRYFAAHIAEHDRLKNILIRLNPTGDYVDFDELPFHKTFNNPEDSS